MSITTRGIMYQAELARQYAENAHAGQVRKYAGQPYIEHPTRVAYELMNSVIFQNNQDCIDAVQAAFLHDTVEDTDVTFESILDIFGEVTASYVWFLTKPPDFVGDRAVRKKLDRARLAEAPTIVKYIKMLDVMDNAVDIEKYDPDFWLTFKAESLLLFQAMGSNTVMGELKKDFDDPDRTMNKYRAFMEKIW